jgi:sulfoxide reductase catalytic subunit YedY
MFVHRRRGWEIPESRVTPERFVTGRRALMAGAAGAILAPAVPVLADVVNQDTKYPPNRATTPEADSTTYNNFYEFGDDKSIWRAAQKMPVSPWQIEFAGMVDKPRTMDIADLLKQVELEERIYRHRCVEAWAMTVPWTGFPVSQLLKIAQPSAGAKYMQIESAVLPRSMPGVRNSFYNWPYVEGLTMAEAQNDLAFMVTGMYGHELPKQDGAPIRLHLPWKYGFKSGKSIVKVTFTDKQPQTFWEQLQPSEYGFWANVNPEVPHPRWSQATERLIGTDERVPTVIWNGYGEWVAGMYADLKSERLFA